MLRNNNFIADPDINVQKYFELFRFAFAEIMSEVCKKERCTSFSWLDSNYILEQPRCDCKNTNPYIYHSPRGFGVQSTYFKNHSKLKEICELEQLFPLGGNRIYRFIVNDGGAWPIHKDKHDNVRMTKQLMFPLTNCNDTTVTRWYHSDTPTFKETSKVIILDRDNTPDLQVIHEESLINDVPKIMNVEDWHNVVNHANSTRVVVGFYIG